MKMKLFAISLALLGTLLSAASSRAANVFVEEILSPVGAATVEIPILIAPIDPAETIGAMNISFSVGALYDSVEILESGTEFSGSIWEAGSDFVKFAGTPATHSLQTAVAMLEPLQVPADGTLVTYTVDVSDLAEGMYLLNPNFEIDGIFTSGDPNIAGTPTGLTFTPGMLIIGSPNPPSITGDYNASSLVEQADLDLVLLNWGGELSDPAGAGWTNDTPSGPIDQSELDKVLLNWGNDQPTLTASTVPEPATWALAAVALAVVARFARLRRP